jgi:hypothetical protein
VVSATSGLLEAADGYASVRSVAPGQPAALADAVCAILDGWPHYRAAALTDRELARERHAPARYRKEVAELVGRVGALRRP